MIDERPDIGAAWPSSSDAAADGSTLLTAFFCGALTGLSIGVLLAPARGADMRRRLGSAARRTYRTMRRQSRRATERTSSVASFVDRTRVPSTEPSAEAGA